MAFQVSPGVQVQEIDLTSGVPAVSASIGGYAGVFNWGPVDEIRLISSEKELANTYASPSSVTADLHLDGVSFQVAASFLKYGNALKVVRSIQNAVPTGQVGAVNSSVSGGGVLVKNAEEYANATLSNYGHWIGKFPGALGNSLQVQVCAYSAPAGNPVVSDPAFTEWTGKSNFTGAPGTSAFADAHGSSNDELHILVLDKDGLWTGTPGTVLERFAYLSQAAGAKNTDGLPNYYVDVINNTSKYIWFAEAPDELPDAGTAATEAIDFMAGSAAATEVITDDLANGADGTVTAADINLSLDILADENVDLNLLFAAGDPDGSGDTVAGHLIAIAEARKDIVAFISPPVSETAQSTDPLTDVLTWYASLNESSSYAVYDSTALKVYDKYNDTYVWIPACGHIAGLCARTDNVADAWYSPAGYNRGVLLGVTKLAYNPAKADRDELFKNKINPIVAFPGQGIVLYGDKTALSKPSAFDAINVRRLFITLEKSISTFAKFQLFEFNDEFTRAAFRNAVEPFLREVQGRRGITDFKVVCDETNNTGDVIDRNEFVADIYIKPARAIRGITLNFIATRTGVSFTELGA